MRRTNEPSTGRQVGVGVALLVIDFVLIAWSVHGVGTAGRADSHESDGVAPSSASRAASQAWWLLGGGAVLTGGGPLAPGRRIPGIVQLFALGGGAALVSSLAAAG
jgi:hypothetical protein